MKTLVLTVLLCLLIVPVLAYGVSSTLQEKILQVTDGATTSKFFTLNPGADVDTTERFAISNAQWPPDNTKPLGLLVVVKPRVLGDDLDSVYFKTQWTFLDTDSAWATARYRATALVWDTTGTGYNTSYSYIFADTTAGNLWFGANTARFMFTNTSRTIGSSGVASRDSLVALTATFVTRRP